MRTISERLSDIQKAATRIMKYTPEGRDRYDHDEFLQAWIIQNLYIVGEATRAIASDFPAFKDQHPQIKWTKLFNMRTFLAHRYFAIDLGVVWSMAIESVPELKRRIDAILEQDKEV